jgi:predicted transcriptional regulator YheO
MSDLTPQINILKTNTNNNSPNSVTRGERSLIRKQTLPLRNKTSMYICDLCINSEESLSSASPVNRCPHRKINLDEFFMESKEKQKEAI